MTIELRFQPYRLFPYERVLARREVTGLGLTVLHQDEAGILASGDTERAALSRLTFFSEVRWNGMLVEPKVAGMERRHRERRNPTRRPRQATRYLVHGLHEYKGKFHPHLVRAFANLLDVQADDLVMDPFSGSGTTLVEALMLDCHGAGADLSPLAVLITDAKIAALEDPDRGGLAARLRAWGEETADEMEVPVLDQPPSAALLGEPARKYLGSWFDPQGYAALLVGLGALASTKPDRTLHLLASVSLSSVLRRSSLQAPEDLRVRRRASDSIPEALPHLLRAATAEAAEAILESVEMGPIVTRATCALEDVSKPGVLRRLRDDARRAAVITSPPYATALPYIDTDRLSMVALGLSLPPELPRLEASLVGSREWAVATQRSWSARLDAKLGALPAEVLEACSAIQEAQGSAAGFRKRAVPALLFRYFTQMNAVFKELRIALRQGERAVFVVGVNRTGRGSEQVVIKTPELLGSIALQAGFDVDELIELETWPRYGLHHENGVPGESALFLTAR